MMRKRIVSSLLRFVGVVCLTLPFSSEVLHAQSTSFAYQGRLSNEGEPADGAHDFSFTLKDAATLGNTVGAPLLVTDVPVVDGLFTATLDFTAAAFDGNPRWLEIAVRPAGSASDFTTLVPRQAISSTPYATRALSAGTATSAATAGFASSVAAGSVGEEQLADGAAAANLAAGGQSGVAPGGLVLSPTDNPALVAAGYTRIGSTTVGDHWELTVPGDVPQRAKHTAVWTGTHLLVWGGSESENGGVRYDPATGEKVPMSRENAPSARSEHGAVWTGQEMLIWGGASLEESGGLATDGGRYDPVSDSWKPINLEGAPPRGGSVVWTGDEMIVWSNAVGDSANSGGRYDPASDTWEPVSTTDAPPSPRSGHTAVWTGTEMIVWGGSATRLSRPRHEALNDGARYNPQTDTWSPVSALNAPSTRFNHTAVWTGTEMIIWGGWSGGRLNDGARYDPVADAWAPVTLAGAPAGRSEHTAVWTGTEMIVYGGAGVELKESAGYDPVSDTWSDLNPASAPGDRAGHTATWTGTEMVVWGGIQLAEFDTGWHYDPVADVWDRPLTGTPAGRFGHGAIWNGTEMIVWGGESIGASIPTLLGTGGRHDPVSKTWTPTSRIDAPAARTDHTMVWTGSEVLVWGGRNEAGEVLGDGGRYDPETDAWSPISMLNAPDSRRGHTAVWASTGPYEGQMIIWGGSRDAGSGWDPGETPSNGGGIYDPATDVWSPIAMLNAPSPRVFHSAIWTGSEMIVWGGLSVGADPQPLGDGSRYDPVTDQWVALDSVGAPTARFSHSATWTGTALIVWGGMQANLQDNASNTGGRYDPVSGDWESLTSSGAPYPRTRHTAVWAGHELIVWGGEAPGYITERFDDGGRYSPDTQGWSPIEGSGVFTNGLGAPSRRQGHTAVWTGTQMLIWGGIGIEGFGEVFSRFNNATWSYTPRKVMYLYEKQ